MADLEPSRPGSRPPTFADEFKKSSYYKRWKGQYEGQRLAPKYDFPKVVTGKDYRPQTPPMHQGETAQQMPYYSKLTPFEQNLYEVLPGFSQTKVGQALAKFSEGWAGKALGYLDVLAEGAERTGSLAVQMFNAETPEDRDELTRNLTSAWYAGSMGADMMNLPTFNYDDDGKVSGIAIPDDLPGSAGLTKARQDIQALVESGVSHSEALQQVKSEYYDSMGALAIRGQLYDTYVHILGDPLNYILPALKPIESIKTLSYFAGSSKWADEVVSLGRKAVQTARQTGKLDEVIEIGNKSGKMIGNLGDEFVRAADAGDVKKVTSMVDKVLDDVGLTTRERIAINITGGKDPFKVPETTWEKFYDRMPWRLTPESRAYEYVTVIQDNIGKHVVEGLDDPYAIYDTIRRAAAGAVGPELGHAFLTIEGRAVQGALKGFDAKVAGLLGEYDLLKKERALLSEIATAAGKSEEEIVGLMKTGDFSVVTKAANMTEDQAKVLLKKLDGKPFSKKMFKLETMNELADWTARQGALMFGVKQRGLVQKLAQAVKSAETLAFLRINPGYMIRNVLNNEITLIARGAGISFNDLKKAGSYFDLDMEPFRFGQGFGAAGDIYAKPADATGAAINEFMKGERGSLDKFTEWVSGKKPFGKLDMGEISSKMESSASKRAFTTSYIRAYDSIWKPDKGFDSLTKYLPTPVRDKVAAEMGEEFFRAVDNKVAGLRKPGDAKFIYSDNLNISVNNILDEATAELGYDVSKSMPPEFIATIRDGLEDAAGKGTVREFMDGVRQKLTDQLDEAAPTIVKKIRDDVAVKVKLEGPASFPKILADAQDELTALGIYHARRTEEINDMVKGVRGLRPGNRELAHEMWLSYQKQADAYYSRTFAKLDGTMQGFRKGVVQDKDLARFADEALENFKSLKNGWRGFWKSKRKRSNAYWKAEIEGKPLAQTWDDVAEQTSREFDEMALLEDDLQRSIDNAVAMAIPEEAQRELYLAGQFQLAELRRTDKVAISELFSTLKNKTPFEREQLWKQAVKERYERFDKIREAQFVGTSAMEGDPKAIQRLEQVAAQMPLKEKTINPYPRYDTKVSRTEYDDYISESIAREAERMRAELSGTGVELAAGQVGEGKVRVSSNPGWYRDLYADGVRRKSVLSALDRIAEGKDVGRANETVLPRIKEMIWDNIAYGTEAAPVGDPAMLWRMGLEDEAIDVFKQWADEGLADLDDAELVRMFGSEEEATRMMDNMLRKDRGEAPRPKPPEVVGEIDLAGRLGISDDVARKIHEFDAAGKVYGREYLISKGFEGDEIDDLIGKGILKKGTWEDKPTLRFSDEALKARKEIQSAGLPTEEVAGIPEEIMRQYRAVQRAKEQLKEAKKAGRSSLIQDAESSSRGAGKRYSAVLKEHGMTNADVKAALGVEVVGKAPVEEVAPTVTKTYISDSDHLIRDSKVINEEIVRDEWWLTRGHPGLDAIERSTLDQVAKPPMMANNLPADVTKHLESYVAHVTGQMGDARYASTRFAEFGRDAALLNYQRRYNFNTWLGTIMPFEFWTTHSMMKWALHSIDRPAMLTSYLRMQKMLLASGAPGQELPARLKGQFRIPMPLLPDWMGDHIFFDPIRAVLPFENFTYGYENEMQRRTQLEGKTMFILNDMAEDGEIDQAEANGAIEARSGDLWAMAEQKAMDDNEELKFNVWDTASMLSAPHAPLDWAVKVGQGRPEDIGPFTPASRTIKGVAGLMGVDWDRHPMNLEARMRTTLGLPAFDQWDDYRIDRMLSNMTAMGEITADQALRAMIDREGDAYNEAITKANKEFGIGAVGSTFGIPAKAYPEGEFLQRSLADDYQEAWRLHDEGSEDAVNNFNELHPEYETRLALWKPPEERLQRFLVDNIWDIWHDLPSLTKWELRDQLGENFEKKFYDPDTRSYDSITLEEMQGWLKLMGGDPPGTLNSEPQPIDLADPEVAWRVQVFYETKWTYFPKELGIDEMQDEYFALTDKKAKKAYRDSHQVMLDYWDWRNDWMHRNPETVPYLTEKPYEFEYSSPEAERRAEQPQPWLTWDEWQQYMGPHASNLMEDHFERGYELTSPLQDRIDNLAGQLGLGYGEALGLMEESLALR